MVAPVSNASTGQCSTASNAHLGQYIKLDYIGNRPPPIFTLHKQCISRFYQEHYRPFSLPRTSCEFSLVISLEPATTNSKYASHIISDSSETCIVSILCAFNLNLPVETQSRRITSLSHWVRQGTYTKYIINIDEYKFVTLLIAFGQP
jgi:hypothetical protein